MPCAINPSVNCGYKYRLDAETKGSTRFRIPTALSCSVPSAARTLLRAGGILNRVDLTDLEHLGDMMHIYKNNKKIT